MQPITRGAWSVPAPLRFWGLDVDTPMTSSQLSDGGLVLISPVSISDGLCASIDARGPVAPSSSLTCSTPRPVRQTRHRHPRWLP